MRGIISIIACCMLLSFCGICQAEKYLVAGINGSTIIAQQNVQTGFSIGILERESESSFVYGALLSYHSFEILNKRGIGYPGVVWQANYNVTSFYVHVPLYWQAPVLKRPTNLYLHLGVALNLCLSAKADKDFIKKLYDPEDPDLSAEASNYDYSHIEDPGPIIPFIENSGPALLLGFRWDNGNLPISCRYTLSKIGRISAIEFYEWYHSLTLSLEFKYPEW